MFEGLSLGLCCTCRLALACVVFRGLSTVFEVFTVGLCCIWRVVLVCVILKGPSIDLLYLGTSALVYAALEEGSVLAYVVPMPPNTQAA